MIELINHIIHPLADKYLRGANHQQAISRIVDLYNDIVEELLEYKKALIQLDFIVPDKDNYYTKEEIQQNAISRIEEIILQFGTFATKSEVTETLTSYITREDITEVLEAYAKTEDTQEKLVSGTNIKTIFGNSVLGEGNISLPIATTTTLGVIKLYNNNGINRSGLVIQEDGSIVINAVSEYGLSRSGDGKLIANIRRSATTSDIDSYNTQSPVNNAAITPANLNYVANLINAYYIEYGSNEVAKAAQAMQNGRVVICVYTNNNVNYYLTCHSFADLTTGEMLFSGIANNTLYYCSVAPGEDWSTISTLNLTESTQLQADWNQTNSSAKDYIKNKPDVQTKLVSGTNIKSINGQSLLDLSTTTDIVVKPVCYLVEALASDSALFTKPNRYYKLTGQVENLQIVLREQISDRTYIVETYVYFTTGSNPNITYISPTELPILADSRFQIVPNTTYELKFTYNGTSWTVTELELTTTLYAPQT